MRILLLLALFTSFFAYFSYFIPQKGHLPHIAVLTKETPAHYKMNEGIEKARKESKFLYHVTYHTTKEQDQTLTTALTEEIIQTQPDLIMSVGALCSQVAHNSLIKRKEKIPLIFVGADPIRLHLLESPNASPQPVTGVYLGQATHLEAAHTLYQIKKATLRSVLIPYSPTTGGGILNEATKKISHFFASKNITTRCIPVEKISEIIPKISGALSTEDTVMVLEDCLCNDVIHGIIKLCNEKGVTLFSSELDHVDKGAACGFGASLEHTGYAAFHQAEKIIYGGIKAENIPPMALGNHPNYKRQPALNTAAAKKQNLTSYHTSSRTKLYHSISPWKQS